MKHGKRLHADIGFSGLHRTFNCPGWIQFWKERKKQYRKKYKRDFEEKQSAPAAEGELLHEYSEQIIWEQITPDDIPDENHRESVQVYTDFVSRLFTETHPSAEADGTYLVEETLSLEHLGGDCWGTPDFAIWTPGKRLDVVDAKFGRYPVEPENNKQDMAAALAVMEQEHVGWDFKEIYLWISQPRCEHDKGPNRSWKVPLSAMKVFRPKLFDVIQEVQKKNAPLGAGEWCKFCPCIQDMDGIPSCPEIALEAQALTRSEFKNFNPVKPDKLTDSELCLVLENAAAFEYWLDECKKEGFHRQVSGDGVPGMKLIKSPGRSSIDKRAYDKWVKKENKTNTLDMEVFYREEPLTVSQFRKKAEEVGYTPEDYQGVIKKSDGSVKLVPVTDGRTEIIPAAWEFE